MLDEVRKLLKFDMQVTLFSDDVIQVQRTHDGLFSSIAYDFNSILHPVFAVNVLLNHEQILDRFFLNSRACEL